MSTLPTLEQLNAGKFIPQFYVATDGTKATVVNIDGMPLTTLITLQKAAAYARRHLRRHGASAEKRDDVAWNIKTKQWEPLIHD